MNAQTAKITQLPTTVDDAIAVFDRSAAGTMENHQTAAWKILRSEIARLREYEHAAGFLAIENAELRHQRAEFLDLARALFRACRENLITNSFDTDSVGVLEDAAFAAISKATGEVTP